MLEICELFQICVRFLFLRIHSYICIVLRKSSCWCSFVLNVAHKHITLDMFGDVWICLGFVRCCLTCIVFICSSLSKIKWLLNLCWTVFLYTSRRTTLEMLGLLLEMFQVWIHLYSFCIYFVWCLQIKFVLLNFC